MKKFDDGDFSESNQSKKQQNSGQRKGVPSDLVSKRDQIQRDSQQRRSGLGNNERIPKFKINSSH